MHRSVAPLLASLIVVLSSSALGVTESPEQTFRRISSETLTALRPVQNDIPANAVEEVVRRTSRHFDYRRMAAVAVGASWLQANQQQQDQLATEVTKLIARTYAKALISTKGNNFESPALRMMSDQNKAVARVTISEPGSRPIQFEYLLQRTDDTWRAYDIVVSGVSLVTNYRSMFVQEVQNSGVDGLIANLAARNRSQASISSSSPTPSGSATIAGSISSANCPDETSSEYAIFKYLGNGRFACANKINRIFGDCMTAANVDTWFKGSPMGLEAHEQRSVVAWAHCKLDNDRSLNAKGTQAQINIGNASEVNGRKEGGNRNQLTSAASNCPSEYSWPFSAGCGSKLRVLPNGHLLYNGCPEAGDPWKDEGQIGASNDRRGLGWPGLDEFYECHLAARKGSSVTANSGAASTQSGPNVGNASEAAGRNEGGKNAWKRGDSQTSQSQSQQESDTAAQGSNGSPKSKYVSKDATHCVEMVPKGFKCDGPYDRFLTNICMTKISVRWRLGSDPWGTQELAPKGCTPVSPFRDQRGVQFKACSWDPKASHGPYSDPCRY